ncbi:uncharacterized protein LOC116245226 [Nymphaea colorata]|nr:uncharacterized protein LOC116245226 [Nymphaea colorata]
MVEALEEFKKIAGSKSQWGLVIIDRTAPDTIYTATNGSPLLIGFSAQEDEILVVSERIAFEKHVNCFFPSNDNEVFELKVNEIPQLKEKMRDRLTHITEPQKVELRPPAQYKNCYYAALASEYFFKKLRCFRKVNLVDPVEMEASDITENETVVLISQSGETKDLISIVGDCKHRESVKTIGIINVEGSTLARKVDYPIYIKVGREVCVAATKSFFHQVLNLIRNKESLYLLGKRESMAIAREAALKIKELNYIHAEALGACEMKHGPIALIESDRKLETAVILFVLRGETFTVMMNALDQMHSRNAFVIIITDCEEDIEEQHRREVEKI